MLGSNYFHYVQDPWGSFCEYSADIDFVSAGHAWPAGDFPPEDSLYLWGPTVPEDFVLNYEASPGSLSRPASEHPSAARPLLLIVIRMAARSTGARAQLALFSAGELKWLTRIFSMSSIVGYGPVGQSLSILLGERGYNVAVFDRWPALYPLPRAVFHDHEIRRVFHAMGIGKDVEQISQPSAMYQWFNADWKTLVEIDWSAESISDGPVGLSFQSTFARSIVRQQGEVSAERLRATGLGSDRACTSTPTTAK